MKEEFWKHVCERMPHFRLLFIILFVLLLGTIFSIVNTPNGTASNIIAKFDLGLLIVLMLAVVFFQWRCGKSEMNRSEWRPEKRQDDEPNDESADEAE